MSIVLTNLKASLFRRGLWRNLALMGLLVLMFALALFREHGPFGQMLISSCLFPLAFAFMELSYEVVYTQRESVGKTFSFCLPGYRESLRKLNVAGMVLSGLGLGLMFMAMRRSDETVFETVLRGVGGFSVGAASDLMTGSTLRFTLSRLEWVIVMLLSPVLIVGGIIAICYAFEYPIIWFPLIPVSVVFSVFVCGRLGDMGRVRCGHRIIVEDAMEQRAQVGYKKTVSPWVEDFFLGSMERCDSRRYLLGGLYRTFGEIMSHWLLILAYIPISALVLSYTNKWIAELVFVISSVIAFKISLPVKSDILFPEGRIERYRASIAAAVGALLLLVAAAAVVTAFSWLFAMLMPDIKGHPCEAIPVRLVYLPCLLAPAFLALQLLGLKARAVGVVNAVVVIISVLFIGEVSYLNAEGYMWPGYTRAVLLSSVFVGGWIAFLLVLRRVCSKWSLVGQGRLR